MLLAAACSEPRGCGSGGARESLRPESQIAKARASNLLKL